MPELAYSRTRHVADLQEGSDRDVLAALQRDDEVALDELIRRKTQPLVQVAYRVLGSLEEAQDVVQMAFVRIWENRHRYQPAWSPNTWIYRITTNLAIDSLRSRRSRERVQEPLRLHVERGHQERSSRGVGSLGDREVHAIFRELAAELTEKQRAIFVLREMEGLSSKEVAVIVGCRESTVRNHLFNARRVLRDELVRRFPEYAPAAGATEGPT
ncbi:MAG TPA: RNA polymerase sigma factor [Thermoanaerobaculia bacterium]|nr:RNA polymerase sigma factor [Thermoanaerobaculia bacterium]